METIQSIGASHGFGFGDVSIYTKDIDFSSATVCNFPSSKEKLIKEFESKEKLLKGEERTVESEVLASYILLLTDSEINSTLDSDSTIEDVFNAFEENAKHLEIRTAQIMRIHFARKPVSQGPRIERHHLGW